MQYPKGKFFQNLDVAVKNSDHNMIMDLFSDQVTDIALKHPDALNAALKHAGIFVTDSLDPKYLVGIVADNWGNKKMLQNISLMIADLNTPPTGGSASHMNAAQVSLPSGNMIGDIAKGIGDVAQAAATITSAALQPKIEKEKNKGKFFDYLTAKQGVKAEIAKGDSLVKSEAEKSKSTLILGSLFLVVAVIGIMGFVAYKNNTSPANA